MVLLLTRWGCGYLWWERGHTPAPLTYGATTTTPQSYTGLVNRWRDGRQRWVGDKYSTRFWDVSGRVNFFAKGSYRQQMRPTSWQTKESMTFLWTQRMPLKKRDVAASGRNCPWSWVTDTVKIEGWTAQKSLDDMGLIIKHRYTLRNARACGGGDSGPLIFEALNQQ